MKNSDDQGTQFDLRAEVLKNCAVIATGVTRCITGIVRNANQAKEATVAFGSVPSTPFNGIPATSVIVQNMTTLTAVVPPAATTGPLVVTIAGEAAISTGHFVVLPTQDMQPSVLPTAMTIPSLGQASFKVTLAGSSVTNLATLAVTGMPAGMTASVTSPTLMAGQSRLLALTTDGSAPAGNVPLTVTATGLVMVSRPCVR
ncbi:MAG: hypothetical protein P0111_16240 [Nitrospira sp.]|nr:hypothetical protein [Nitrospira sp.]